MAEQGHSGEGAAPGTCVERRADPYFSVKSPGQVAVFVYRDLLQGQIMIFILHMAFCAFEGAVTLALGPSAMQFTAEQMEDALRFWSSHGSLGQFLWGFCRVP
ncbi:hypothetical protein E5288_WYG003346 [Bos mutus]|uniref:Uncharacterized protein n=1 Tax=Bos mutus TaxID=72004 RepID=A0A6B0RIC9_9CETA|nr:hypothetical protein [Bos mutus]